MIPHAPLHDAIDDAVDLVLCAFQNGNPGAAFVQKAPVAMIGILALARKKFFKTDTEMRIIGARHGEKPPFWAVRCFSYSPFHFLVRYVEPILPVRIITLGTHWLPNQEIPQCP